MKFRENYQAVHSYMKALLEAENWGRLLGVLKYLRDRRDEHGVSHLARFFGAVKPPEQLGRACRAWDKPAFILEAFSQTLLEAEKGSKKMLLIRYLLFFGKFAITTTTCTMSRSVGGRRQSCEFPRPPSTFSVTARA